MAQSTLEPGHYYHVYNRGNNSEPLFREKRNYQYFLDLWGKYTEPIAETYAYCLLSNHFHFLIRIKTPEEQPESEPDSQQRPMAAQVRPRDPSRQFNSLFIAYAKAFNKLYQRTGALFERPFKRKLVDEDRYFTWLIAYIHWNPQKHSFVDDFRVWPYSSYRAILSDGPTRLRREQVLSWFDGRSQFIDWHLSDVDESVIEPLIKDDRP